MARDDFLKKDFHIGTEFGKRFNFPENIKFEYDGMTGCVANDVAVRMAEKWEDFVVEQIVAEAVDMGISDLTVLNKPAIISALRKQTPIKPLHIHEVYPKHDWELDEDGEIDIFAMENGFHNGPRCRRCYHSPCVHCTPNWDEGECIVDYDLCPSCNKRAIKLTKFCPDCGQALDWGDEK